MKHIISSYFPDKNYTLLYLHGFLKGSGFLVMNLYLGGWLYEIGIPLYAIIAYHCLHFLLMGLFSGLSPIFIKNIGIPKTFCTVGILMLLSFAFIAMGNDHWQFIIVGMILSALGNGIHNTFDMIFHCLYVHDDHRGKAISFVNTVTAIVSAILIALSGWLITQYGFWGIFIIYCVAWMGSIAIIFFMDKSPVPYLSESKIKDLYKNCFIKDYRDYAYIALGFQFVIVGFVVLIPIALYLATDNFQDMAFIAAIAIILQTALTLIQGIWVDKNKSAKPMRFALGVNGIGLATFALLPQYKLALFFADFMQRTGLTLYMGTFWPLIHRHMLDQKKSLHDMATIMHMQFCYWEFISLTVMGIAFFIFGETALPYCLIACILGSFITYTGFRKLDN